MTNTKQQNSTIPSGLKQEVLFVGKNSMIYVVGQALSRAVGFFMIPIYTRFILPGDYGAMDLIGIISAITAMIIAMGASDSMSRYYYAEKDPQKRNEVVSTIIIAFGALAIPIVIIFMSLSGILSLIVIEEPKYRFYLQIAIASVWFGMLCEISFTYLRMRYMAKLFVLVTTLQLILALSLNIWFVVFEKLGILGIFYSTLITQGFVGISLSFVVLRKVGKRVSFSLLQRLVCFGLPLVPVRIAHFLGFVANRLFLRWLGSPDPVVALTMVGIFSLGNKFGTIISDFINAPFNSYWAPRRMEVLLSKGPEFKETVARICTYGTMLSIYIALGLSAGIKDLIAIIADPKYHGAYIVVPFIALTCVAVTLEWHLSVGIIYTGKTIWLTFTNIFAISVVLFWNYIFIPKYGVIGAATSNLAGFVVRTILTYLIGQRLYPIPFEMGRIVLLFVTAIALFLISQLIVFTLPWLTFLTRTGIVAFYPLALFFVGFYKREELDFLFKTLKKIFAKKSLYTSDLPN